jgi:hypothetical protein
MGKGNGKGGKLLPHSDLRGGVYLEETPRGRNYSKKEDKGKQKVHHRIKLGTWNVIITLNQGGKLESLKKEMQKNAVSALGISEVQWKGW